MDVVSLIVIAILLPIIFYCLWMCYRTHVVAEYRLAVLRRAGVTRCWMAFDSLPDFCEMIFVFWKYPIKQIKEDTRCALKCTRERT